MVSRFQQVIFPLAAASLTVIINGTPMHAYQSARIEHGRIVAPVLPFITQVADAIGFEGDIMVIRRGSFLARIRTGRLSMDHLQRTFIALVPIYRALGERCTYDRATGSLRVNDMQVQPVRTMEPFDPSAVQVRPTTVFTPEPVITPRPVFWGRPRPRRTPIPVTPSRP